MEIVKAPASWFHSKRPFIFLAGSIEMGKAVMWQDKLTENRISSSAIGGLGTFLNPRREDWDSSWKQSIEDKQFREQVQWELEALASADIIAMYFDPETKSPITLLELGLHAASGKLIVCCPMKFWRRGNVEMVCNRYRIPLSSDWDPFAEAVWHGVGSHQKVS